VSRPGARRRCDRELWYFGDAAGEPDERRTMLNRRPFEEAFVSWAQVVPKILELARCLR
jgi:hypothetical protein